MRNDRRPGRQAPPEEDPAPTLEDELEEAAELLPQQEPSEVLLPDPSTPTAYVEPALIDPAD